MTAVGPPDDAPAPPASPAFPRAPKPWSLAFADDSAFLFSKIGSRAKKLFGEALKPLDLRPNHVVVLNYLRTREGASQREIVDGLWIDASSLVALLDEFERRGLAERRPSENDRRAHAVYLTPEGGRVLERALALSKQVEARLLAALAPAERDHLHSVLMRIVGDGEVAEAGDS